MRKSLSLLMALAILGGVFATFEPATPPAAAAPIEAAPFERTWARTDKPVIEGSVARTWMWGPEAHTGALQETYAESPGGTRLVQYFDKSRMEITHPDGDQSSPWYVTNGLLVMELVTGRMQTGDTAFVDRAAAEVPVAGDGDDTDGPTYATFAGLLSAPAASEGVVLQTELLRDGSTLHNAAVGAYNVVAAHHVPATGHTIAAPFWEFMNSRGAVWDGSMTTAPLFENPFYATGYPISEAYWATVRVAGTPRSVLLQCFERRCLTYTPENPAEWQVEMGNVGQHYFRWRHAEVPAGPSPQANALVAAIVAAGDDEARYQALLPILDALNIGVYMGDGTPVVRGAERGEGDFYLYDIEARMLAQAIGRGEQLSVEALAGALTSLPLLAGGAAVNPDLLRQTLIEGAQASAATPAEPSSLLPLIVRQLGLTQPKPYDLFVDTAADDLAFDALQSFLILTDILLPTVAAQGPVMAGASSLLAQAEGVLKAVPGESCESIIGNVAKEMWPVGKWALGLIAKVGGFAAGASVTIDALHGAMLAYSVRVTALDERQGTHYGPAGHATDAGKELRFRMQVEMLDELPEQLIKCGWILGVEFPKQGPIKDITMTWDTDGLEQHGQVICEATCKKTGEDGIATLVFRPKDEPNQDGMVVYDSGVITSVALYQSRHQNLIGSVAQFLTPKYGLMRWDVARHEQPGWAVTARVQYDIALHRTAADGAGPLEEGFTGQGAVTYTFTIPGSAIGAPGQQSVVGTARGAGSFRTWFFDNTSSKVWGDFAHDCRATYDGSWPSGSRYGPIIAMDDGERIVTTEIFYPSDASYFAIYQSSGSFNGGGDENLCRDNVWVGASNYPLTYVQMNVPDFSLDVSGPQRISVEPTILCDPLARVTIGSAGNTISQTCVASAEWTIEVKYQSSGAS